MNFNRNEHSRFVQRLDKIAETNSILRLPCIILLIIALGAEQLHFAVRNALSYGKKDLVNNKTDVQLSKKPFVLRVAAISLVFTFSFMTIPELSEIISYDVSADDSSSSAETLSENRDEHTWHSSYNSSGNSIMTVDYLDFNDNYFVKVSNIDYSDAYVEREFNVKPYTKYRFSAMVKSDGYQPNPSELQHESGASIGKSWSFYRSPCLTNSDWTLLEYCFETENETEVSLCLRNGMFSATCMGTAWFTNIELEEYTQPENSSKNIEQHDYINGYRSSQPIKSYLTERNNGIFERFEYIPELDIIVVENYSKDGICLSEKQISMELDHFGGFYSGQNYNFVVFGQYNPDFDDSVEVLRVVKYSKNWDRLDDMRLYGEDTKDLFGFGSLRMNETGDLLIVHTCHGMYNGHQSNFRFTLNKSTMEFDRYLDGYVSHSFNQFVQTDTDYIYKVDHGDAFPRGVQLSKESINESNGIRDNKLVFEILGKYDDFGNDTGVSVGGFELSNYGSIIAANSVDQSDSITYDPHSQRNIIIIVTSNDMTSSEIKQLTNYSLNTAVGNPYLIKINDNHFAVMWEETINSKTIVKYLTVDSMGNIITPEVGISTRLSDCQPVVINGNRIMWYYTNNWSPTFVTIDFNGKIDTGHNISSSYSNDRTGHWFDCSDCNERVSYAEHIVNIPKATTNEPVKCVICGYVIEDLNSHTHSFAPNWANDSTSHWHECSCSERSNVAQHTENSGVVTVQPTETTEGIRIYSCTVCGYVMRTEAIPVLPPSKHIHSFGTNWTYGKTTHWHECSCGERSDTSQHIENSGVVTVQSTETTEGIRTYSCKVCGYVMRTEAIPVLPPSKHIHSFGTSWKYGKTTHWHECSCGERSDTSQHIENSGVVTVQSTETTEGIRTYSCKVCGYVMRTETIPVLSSPKHTHFFGMNWKYGKTTHWHECSCGERSDTSQHIENSGVVTVQPTETTGGTRTYSCTVCGYVMRTETIPALGVIDSPDHDNINSNKKFKVSVRSELTGLSSKGSHIESNRKFFSESAEVRLTETTASQNAAELAMDNLDCENLICYPFDISVYSTATGKKIQLRHSGYITFEIPVPESMTDISDSIEVYHIANGVPELIESEIITDTSGNEKIRFTANEFSPYMFAAETAEDITAKAAATTTSSDVTTPVSNGVTLPTIKMPRIAKLTGKRKKFRVIRKRRIGDILFAF